MLTTGYRGCSLVCGANLVDLVFHSGTTRLKYVMQVLSQASFSLQSVIDESNRHIKEMSTTGRHGCSSICGASLVDLVFGSGTTRLKYVMQAMSQGSFSSQSVIDESNRHIKEMLTTGCHGCSSICGANHVDLVFGSGTTRLKYVMQAVS